MKTNLDALFKTNKALEKDGVWFEVSDTTAFRVGRFNENSQKVREAISKYAKPHAGKAKQGLLTASEDLEISVKTFVHACVIDWRGVIIEGTEEEFTKEKCIDLLISMPDLYKVLQEHATDKASFLEEMGNS